MKTNIELRLLNDNNEALCKIDAVTYYDDNNEFDEGETFYIHPMTGSECQTVDQVFQGWSEQDEEQNKYWNILRDKIYNDAFHNNLSQYFADEVNRDYYL